MIGDYGTLGKFADALRLADGFVPDAFTSTHWRVGVLMAHAGLGQPDAALAIYRDAVAQGERESAYVDLSMIHRAAQANLIVPYYADQVAWRDECAAAGERAAAAAARVGFLERPPLLAWSSILYPAGRWTDIETFAATTPPSTGKATYMLYMAAMLGPFARARGDADRAWEQIRTILPAGPASEPGQGFFWASTRLQSLAALLALDAGDLPLARSWLTAHDRWLDWGGAVLGVPRPEPAGRSTSGLWAIFLPRGSTPRRLWSAPRHRVNPSPSSPLTACAANSLPRMGNWPRRRRTWTSPWSSPLLAPPHTNGL